MKKHNSNKLYLIYRYHLDMQNSRIPPLLTGVIGLSSLTGVYTEHVKKFYGISDNQLLNVIEILMEYGGRRGRSLTFTL